MKGYCLIRFQVHDLIMKNLLAFLEFCDPVFHSFFSGVEKSVEKWLNEKVTSTMC